MRAIITGGAGFIGSHLAKRLEAEGHEVVVLDNFHTGRRSNLEGFKGRVLETDVKNIRALTFAPDVIYHLGMYSSSPMYLADRSLVGEVVAGATAIFDYALNREYLKVVYASTSSVYNGYSPPYREDMPPVAIDFYTEARVCVERLAKVYHTLYGLNALGLRFFSVYGPGEESKGVYANMATQFVWAAKGQSLSFMGRKPTIYGDGSITRDFVHVDDVVDALLLAMHDGSGVINVGTGRGRSFSAVLASLSSLTAKDIRGAVDFVPMPQNYLLRQEADTTKAEKVLGFRAKREFSRSLREMLEA